MKNGFTSKELVITLFILGLITSIALFITSNLKNNSDKTKLVNQANLYITSLNSSIIDASNEGKTILYQTYLPINEGETVTFDIERIRINKTNEYRGIIKVTYEGSNNYKYKIAIHNDKFMLGTEKKLIEQENIKEELIKDYKSNLFKK